MSYRFENKNYNFENKNDLYKILGIEKNSDISKIKKAYRKLALKYHPDKNPSKDSVERFMEIQYAYEILSNEETRYEYDKMNKTSITFDKWVENHISNKNYFNLYLIVKSKIFTLNWLNLLKENNTTKIKSITSILDIEITLEFTLYEIYNNISKTIDVKRITKENFIEEILPIDFKQIYEDEGENIKIDKLSFTGDFIINIKIKETIYKGLEYHIVNSDIYIMIKNNNIINDVLDVDFVDGKKYNFSLKNLDKEKIDTGYLYKINGMGLNYFNTDEIIIDSNNCSISRGNLFFILLL